MDSARAFVINIVNFAGNAKRVQTLEGRCGIDAAVSVDITSSHVEWDATGEIALTLGIADSRSTAIVRIRPTIVSLLDTFRKLPMTESRVSVFRSTHRHLQHSNHRW